MIITDAVKAANIRKTADGYLVADAPVARIGIQEYLGSELGRPDLAIVRVYRPESSVFATDSIKSYAHRPITNDHPHEQVTASNWRDVAIGQTGGDVVRDGDFVRVPLVLMDATAIAAYESGKHELSMGYSADIEFVDGVTPDGLKYDAIVTGSMRMNHLALVDMARGGHELRIGDNQTGGLMAAELKKIMVDGLTIDVTDQGAQAIEKLQKQLADGAKTLAERDVLLAKKDAEIDSLKAQALTDAQLDAKVRERADLIGKAKLVFDADYSGKGEAEIRRFAVVGKIGDAAIAGKPDAYIEARFDLLVEDSAKAGDPMQRHMADHANAKPQSVNDNGQNAYEDRLKNAWKGA